MRRVRLPRILLCHFERLFSGTRDLEQIDLEWISYRWTLSNSIISVFRCSGVRSTVRFFRAKGIESSDILLICKLSFLLRMPFIVPPPLHLSASFLIYCRWPPDDIFANVISFFTFRPFGVSPPYISRSMK